MVTYDHLGTVGDPGGAMPIRTVLRTAVLYFSAFILLLSPAGCSDRNLKSEIESGEYRSAATIHSYHMVAMSTTNYSRDAPGGRRYELIRSETWAKNPGFYKEIRRTIESTMNPGPSTWATFISSRTYTMQNGDRQVTNNCTPESLRSFRSDPYDLESQLGVGVDDPTVKLSRTTFNGERAYRLEREYRAGGNEDNNAGKGLERIVMIVEEGSSICLQRERYTDGFLVTKTEVESFEPGVSIDDSSFVPPGGNWEHSETTDEGYRDLSIDQAGSVCNVQPLTPSYLPRGYELSSTGWRDESVTGLSLDIEPAKAPIWYKPFYMQYTDGVQLIDICQGQETEDIPEEDALTVNTEDSLAVGKLSLAGGQLAYYTPQNHTLSFILKNTKVKLQAFLPLNELKKIANSMD